MADQMLAPEAAASPARAPESTGSVTTAEPADADRLGVSNLAEPRLESARHLDGARPQARHWGATFDPDELARLELGMWKAYYRRQPARLFGLLVLAERAQAGVSLPRAVLAAVWLTRAAIGFARATGDYERYAAPIARGYSVLRLPDHVDIEEVARRELRWWVVRREIGLAAGAAAGDAITRLYAELYELPEERVAEAGRLRGLAPKSATAARPTTRRDRRRPAGRIGRRWRDSCATRIGACGAHWTRRRQRPDQT